MTRADRLIDPAVRATAASDEAVAIAERIARKAHARQKEESTGDDYIHHVERVVARVDGNEAKAVAWLHDVFEDSDVTVSDLMSAGIPITVIKAVLVLTQDEAETYAQYIRVVADQGSTAALLVKQADLIDHLHPNCPARLRPRYEKALPQITAALRGASSVSPQPNESTVRKEVQDKLSVYLAADKDCIPLQRAVVMRQVEDCLVGMVLHGSGSPDGDGQARQAGDAACSQGSGSGREALLRDAPHADRSHAAGSEPDHSRSDISPLEQEQPNVEPDRVAGADVGRLCDRGRSEPVGDDAEVAQSFTLQAEGRSAGKAVIVLTEAQFASIVQFLDGSLSPDGDGRPIVKGLGNGASLRSTPSDLPGNRSAYMPAEALALKSSLKPADGSEPSDSLQSEVAVSSVSPVAPLDASWIEARLRAEWWTGHGCPFNALYGDDGEMQCNASTCRRDFKREPLETLRQHVESRRLQRAVDIHKAAAALHGASQERADETQGIQEGRPSDASPAPSRGAEGIPRAGRGVQGANDLHAETGRVVTYSGPFLGPPHEWAFDSICNEYRCRHCLVRANATHGPTCHKAALPGARAALPAEPKTEPHRKDV